MAAKDKVRLRITTPNVVKYVADVDMVILRATTGDIGIMAHHVPEAVILDDGVMRILNDGAEFRVAVFGGIAQVRNNRVTVVANEVQFPEEIDRAFAEMERARIERRIKENADGLDIQRDQVLMRRTLVQIEVSSYPLIGGRTMPPDIKDK